ncbi:MAG: response regulator [Xenococcaceae cyanobacterium MO_188.B29]|nr:response regulator [Xenococcaceae cyanobacterium MO_188.B29]
MVTILIVDDSNSLRQAFSSILTPLKMKVLLANNGNHAIQMLGQHTPDLVITDLIMPEMNGYELCRWIKNNPSTQTIPVLMCSTKSEEFDRYWGMKQGADAYMTKPFQAAELITTVQQLLEISQSR